MSLASCLLLWWCVLWGFVCVCLGGFFGGRGEGGVV